MPKLTKRNVDSLSATGSRFIQWDDELAGFGCRVSPEGRKAFVVDFSVNGRRRRMTLGRHGVITAEQARAMARDALAKAALGTDPMQGRDEARADLTVAELCDLYLSDGVGQKRASTLATDRGRIERHIKPLLGNKPVRQVSPQDVQHAFHEIRRGKTARTAKTGKRGLARVRGGEGTARRTIGLLGGIFAYAVKHGLCAENPAHGIDRGKDDSRERFLSASELRQLAGTMASMEADGSLHPYSAAIIRLLLFTGARRGEICNARWEDLDLERGVLLVPKGKTGRRHIRLAAPAVKILSDLPCRGAWVFPASHGSNAYQGLPKQWRNLRNRAGLEGVRVHDLRHTFASYAVQGGASLYLVQHLLGHANASMTQRYAHLADDPIASANEAVASSISDLFQDGEHGSRDVSDES